MTCGNKSIQDETTMWLFPYFIEKLAAEALMEQLSLKWKSWHHSLKEAVLTTRCQLLNYVLEACGTDDIIAEKDKEISRYIKLLTTLQLNFGTEPWHKTFRHPLVNDIYVLKDILVKGLR